MRLASPRSAGTVDIEQTDRGPKSSCCPTPTARRPSRRSPVEYLLPRRTRLLVEKGQHVEPGDPLNEGSLAPVELLELHHRSGKGATPTELYLVGEVQKVYKSQGVDIHDKHIELIVRQMLKKVRIVTSGDADFLPGQMVDRVALERENARVKKEKGAQATYEPIILGITKASLATESFLSAASFQETTKVLTDAAIEGKIDRLLGLKENVIIGKLIPAATGLKRYRTIGIGPSAKVPKEMYEREAVLAALEEIESDGGTGIDLASLGIDLDLEAAGDGDGKPEARGREVSSVGEPVVPPRTPSLSLRLANPLLRSGESAVSPPRSGARRSSGLAGYLATLSRRERSRRSLIALACGRRPRPGVACGASSRRHRRRLRPPGSTAALAGLRRGLGVVPKRRLRPAGRDRGNVRHRQLHRAPGARGADGLLVDEAEPRGGDAVCADRSRDGRGRHHRDRRQGRRGHGVLDARHRAQRAQQRSVDDAVDAHE